VKNIAFEEERVVTLERLERLARAPGVLGTSLALGSQRVDVLVERLARVDLVLDAIEAGIIMTENARYGLAVGSGQRTRGAWPWASCRRSGCGPTRALRDESQVDRRLVARHQALVAVGAGLVNAQIAGACLRMPPM